MVLFMGAEMIILSDSDCRLINSCAAKSIRRFSVLKRDIYDKTVKRVVFTKEIRSNREASIILAILEESRARIIEEETLAAKVSKKDRTLYDAIPDEKAVFRLIEEIRLFRERNKGENKKRRLGK